jgi:GntR family transcriptional regulator
MHTHQQKLLAILALKQDGVPIYVQLREQVLQALGARILGPGDQMPTMREVASAMKVDLNTVRHAYDELERLGAITLVRGRGSFVAEQAVAKAASKEDQTDNLARQAIGMAAAAGIDPMVLADRIAVLSWHKEETS